MKAAKLTVMMGPTLLESGVRVKPSRIKQRSRPHNRGGCRVGSSHLATREPEEGESMRNEARDLGEIEAKQILSDLNSKVACLPFSHLSSFSISLLCTRVSGEATG